MHMSSEGLIVGKAHGLSLTDLCLKCQEIHCVFIMHQPIESALLRKACKANPNDCEK